MSVGKIIFLEDTLEEMINEYLYEGNQKYLKFNKRLYGINYDKWSSYYLELLIVKLFEEELRGSLSTIDNSFEISKTISKEIKEERERILTHCYTQGFIFGYNSYILVSEFVKLCEKTFQSRNCKELHISDIVRSGEIGLVEELIEIEKVSNDIYKRTEDILHSYLNESIYKKIDFVIKGENSKFIKKCIFNIMLSDCKDKNKDGVWDGIIKKSICETHKKYTIRV